MASLCKVTSIYFNYFQANRTVNGKQPECGLNVMPEDISRFPTIPYNAVAFAMDATDPKAYSGNTDETETYPPQKLKLHAEFKGPKGSSLMLRTIAPAEHEVKKLKSYLEMSLVSLTDADDPMNCIRLLGDIEPITIKFNEDGFAKEGIVELTISSADIWSRGICASWQLWKWQYSTDEGKSWETAGGLLYEGISIHRIFITKNTAAWPWTGYDEEVKTISGNSSPSRSIYLGALEWACKWAAGEKTEKGIASKITAALNDGNGDRFRYDSPAGANNYTSKFSNNFDCGRFIDRLNGKFGRGPKVNCVDCAHMVISLANALGCRLQPGKIKNPKGEAFKLNPLTLIGYNELDQEIKSFGYHQVVISPSPGEDSPDYVYDACIKFDMEIFKQLDSAPEFPESLTPQQEHGHPVDIPIGANVFTYGYLAILAKPLKEPSQSDLTVYKGGPEDFSISAIKFI